MKLSCSKSTACQESSGQAQENNSHAYMQANKGGDSEGPKHKECQKVRNVTKCKRLKLSFLSKKKYHTSSLPIGQFISQVSLHPILHGMKMGTTATCEDNNGWSSLHLNDTFFTMVVGEAFYMYLKMFFFY